MNYNDLSDDEIDMLIATRAAGWQLSEETAYSPTGGRWARISWNDGRGSRERWLPYYTESFDDAIAAAQHLMNTNERAIEPFINGLSLTYKAAISRFIGEATPRALCILILEALDAAALPATWESGEAANVIIGLDRRKPIELAETRPLTEGEKAFVEGMTVYGQTLLDAAAKEQG